MPPSSSASASTALPVSPASIAPSKASASAAANPPRRWPGLLLALGLGLGATLLAELPFFQSRGFGALTLAIVLGILFGNTGYRTVEPYCAPGVNFSKHWFLRAGIVLYGLRLTLQDVAQVGVSGVVIDAVMIGSTFALALWLGQRWLRLPANTVMLIGSGSAICGAAAVLATQPVLKARGEEVATAISTVVVFGTIGMFLYPHLLAPWSAWLGSPAEFGVYIGSTVHEVAQVVAAAEAADPALLDDAVITKMVRVMMLAPFLLMLSWRVARGNKAEAGGEQRSGISVPWFAFGFIALVAVHSLVKLPAPLHHALVWIDGLLLAMAMASLGLTTRIAAVRQSGLKPLLLAAMLMLWLTIGGAAVNVGVRAAVQALA